MSETSRPFVAPLALLIGILYFVLCWIFGSLADHAVTISLRTIWRFAAFGVCGVVFLTHVAYSRLRLGSAVMATALHAALGAAVGGFLLAVGANAHSWQTHTGDQVRLAIALVAWPVVTGVPAFLLALAGAAVLRANPAQRTD